jgi:hypothetical protein
MRCAECHIVVGNPIGFFPDHGEEYLNRRCHNCDVCRFCGVKPRHQNSGFCVKHHKWSEAKREALRNEMNKVGIVEEVSERDEVSEPRVIDEKKSTPAKKRARSPSDSDNVVENRKKPRLDGFGRRLSRKWSGAVEAAVNAFYPVGDPVECHVGTETFKTTVTPQNRTALIKKIINLAQRPDFAGIQTPIEFKETIERVPKDDLRDLNISSSEILWLRAFVKLVSHVRKGEPQKYFTDRLNGNELELIKQVLPFPSI